MEVKTANIRDFSDLYFHSFCMIKTTIDLLRHGEPEGGDIFRGCIDKPLTARGREQMHAQTHWLRRHGDWDAVLSSPQRRCLAFAQEVAQSLALEALQLPGMREISFGDWEGRPVAEVLAQSPDALQNFWRDPWRFGPPNGEPMDDFQRRVMDAWAEVIERHAGQRVLLVTHGAVIRLLLTHALDAPIHTMQRLHVPFASVSRVHVFSKDGAVASAQLVFHGNVDDP